MEYKNLLVETKNRIATVKLNRPDKLNALNTETMNELRTVFTHINDDKEVYVVILTGSGEKAFVAGADISELNKLTVESAKEFAENGQSVFNLIENMNKPVIAAINGFALGGGCELALSCHIRIASENARFGQPEVNLGIIPGYGGTQRLTRLINSGRAMEYILSGDMIDSSEAFRIGLVNNVYPLNELMNKAFELAEKISAKGQFAVQQALKCVNIVDEVSESEGLNFEAASFAMCCGTKDFKEGTNAFLEKRKPAFKNE